MKHVLNELLRQQSGVAGLSLEEIEAEVAAAPEQPEAVDVVAAEVAEEDPLETELDEHEIALDEQEEAVEEVEQGADVSEKLEETVQAMEALVESGSCSLIEYTALSEYAGIQMSRVTGKQSSGFSMESINTPEGRIDGLRLALEAVKADKVNVKKAVDEAAAKVQKEEVSLWNKFLALLGSRTKRIKVILSELSKVEAPVREEVTIGSGIAKYMVDNDASKTAAVVTKATEYFYNDLYDQLADWSARKVKAPKINSTAFSDLPGDFDLSCDGSRLNFDYDIDKGQAFTEKTLSKNEIKKVLGYAERIVATLRKASTDFMGFSGWVANIYVAMSKGSNAANVVGGLATGMIPVAIVGAVGIGFAHLLGMVFSRSYNTMVKVNRVFTVFTRFADALMGYATKHISAYK